MGSSPIRDMGIESIWLNVECGFDKAEVVGSSPAVLRIISG